MKKTKLKIMKLMQSVGISANLKGYDYICEYLLYVYTYPVLRYGHAVDIYCMIANAHAVSCDSVARAIRTAIEKAWLVCDMNVLRRYFGNTVSTRLGRPSNTEFLGMMLRYLELYSE